MDAAELLPGVRAANERCLVLDDGPTVVLGDLHLGYERALEDEGVFIPRVNTRSIRDSLNRIICRYEPERIVLLGDIKHDFRRAGGEGREEVASLLRMLSEAAEVVPVKGNHDNYLQNILSDLGLLAADHVDLCGFRMEHGHADSGVRPAVIAHEHPSVRIRGPFGEGIKLQCFLHFRKEGLIVIPPFSPLTSGTDVSSGDPSAFMSPACRSADAADALVYAVSEIGVIPAGRLGDVRLLGVRRPGNQSGLNSANKYARLYALWMYNPSIQVFKSIQKDGGPTSGKDGGIRNERRNGRID